MVILLLALALVQTLSTLAPATPAVQSETRQPTVRPGDMCTIEGVVVRATTSDPLKRAVLELRRDEDRDHLKSATSDASGYFQFKDIEPGRYHLYAARDGYVNQEYGQLTSQGSGTILTLTAGQQLKDISFRLIPAAVIAGHIYDEDGVPVADAEIQALRFQYEKGQRRLAPVGGVTTNDLGEYRLYGLSPGQYYVSASYNVSRLDNEAPEAGYATVYYPSSGEASRASPLDLQGGDELTGIDFALAPVKTFNVKGQVYDAVTSRPAIHATVWLEPRGTEALNEATTSQNFAQDVRGPQGAFELHGVKSGSYYAVASSTHGDKTYMAREAIDVAGADVEGIGLVIGPGIDLKGRIRIERNHALDVNVLDIWLRARDGIADVGDSRASINPDGSFVIWNVAEGGYQLEVAGLPEDFYLKAVRLAGNAALGSDLSVSRKQPTGSLDLVLSPKAARIDGHVLKGEKPFSGATVVLVPEEGRHKQEHLYKSTSSDQDGRFSIRGIAPGEYTLFAWESIEKGAYQDPEFVRGRKQRGKPVHLEEGYRLNSQLELIPANEPGAP